MSSERKPTPKDTWEKIDIVGKGIVLPLAVAALTLVVNMSLSQINERLKTSENDIHLMTTFKDIYYGKGSKRLAVYFTRQISDRNTRHQLEMFIVWDALEGHLIDASAGRFVFNSEDGDWHMLGDAVRARFTDTAKDDEKRECLRWW